MNENLVSHHGEALHAVDEPNSRARQWIWDAVCAGIARQRALLWRRRGIASLMGLAGGITIAVVGRFVA